MPWENDAVPYFDPTPPEPGFGEILGAAFGRENLIGSAIVAATRPRLQAPPDPTFDPWAAIQGTKYEARARLFADTNSLDDVRTRMQVIDSEDAAADMIAGSTTGMLAGLAAGILDPVNLIPIGGTGYRVARTGSLAGRVALGAARFGAGAAAGQALQEAGLQATQLTRPLEESALNISAAAVLGGVLGGAAGGLTRPLQELGESSAHGTAIFDREVAARRNESFRRFVSRFITPRAP